MQSAIYQNINIHSFWSYGIINQLAYECYAKLAISEGLQHLIARKKTVKNQNQV